MIAHFVIAKSKCKISEFRFTRRVAWAKYFTQFLNGSKCHKITSNFLCLDKQALNVLP